MPITNNIIELLQKYWHQHKTKTFVFSGQNERPQYSASSSNALVKKYIGKQYRFHSLRKSCATHLYEMGNDLAKIQDLLGHAKPETTRTYVQQSLKSIKCLTPLIN